MNRVVVTVPVIGFCYMQVCAVKNATDKEILAVANAENPSGTSGGWVTVHRESDEIEGRRPLQCVEHSDRLHFLVSC